MGQEPQRCWPAWTWRRRASITRSAPSRSWHMRPWRCRPNDRMYADAAVDSSRAPVKGAAADRDVLGHSDAPSEELDTTCCSAAMHATDASAASTPTERTGCLLEHQVGQSCSTRWSWRRTHREACCQRALGTVGRHRDRGERLKSFKRPIGPPPDDGDGAPSVDFHGVTGAPTPRTRARRTGSLDSFKGLGKEARLVFMAHALMETRNGCWWIPELARATPAGLRGGHARKRGHPASSRKTRAIGLQRYRWTQTRGLCASPI